LDQVEDKEKVKKKKNKKKSSKDMFKEQHHEKLEIVSSRKKKKKEKIVISDYEDKSPSFLSPSKVKNEVSHMKSKNKEKKNEEDSWTHVE
jgi:hypothetical protein